MSKRIWIALGVALLAAIILAGVAAGVLFFQRQQQHEEWRESGIALHEQGKFVESRNMLGLYLKNHPEDVDTLDVYVDSVLQITANRRDNLSRAATGLSQMLRHLPAGDPRREDIINELIDVYVKTEAWGDLQFFCQQRIDEEGGNDRLRYHLGLAFQKQGRLDQAERVFEELVDDGAQQPDAYRQLAILLSDRQLDVRAQEVLDRGLEVMADSPAIRVERARYYWETRDLERAHAELDAALEQNPDHSDALVTKATFLNAERKFEEAIEYGERAVELSPDNGSARSVLAFAYRRTGRIEDAIGLLKSAQPTVRVDNPSLLLALAELQYAANELVAAEETVEAYLEAYPTHEAIRDYFAGRRALIDGDAQTAIEKLSLVYEEQPTFAPAQFFLVSAYLEAGEREKARNTLDIYLRNYPEDESARALMAREFRQFDDPASLQEMALGSLANQNADAESLVQAALPMFNAAMVRGETSRAGELAVRLFEEAIRRDPGFGDAYAGLADVYTALGELDKAEEAIQRGMDAGVDKSVLALSRANIAQREGDAERVARLMREDLVGDGASVERVLQWTSFLRSRLNYDLALTALDAVVPPEDDKGATRLKIERMRVLAESGRPEAAAALDEELRGAIEEEDIELARQYAGARLELAQHYLQDGEANTVGDARAIVEAVRASGFEKETADLLYADILARGPNPDFKESMALLEGIIERNPNALRALLAGVNVAMAQGELDAARDFAEQAVRQAPTFIPAQLKLGEILLELNEISLARITLEDANEIAPGNFQILQMLSQVYLREGLRDAADRTIQELEAAAAGRPEQERIAASRRSEFLRMSGEGEEAEALLRQQLDSAPHDLDLARQLAEFYVTNEQPDEGVAVMQQFTSDHPDRVEGWLALARIYMAGGGEQQVNQAQTALTRALILDPGNVNALEQMVDVMSAQNNYTDALAVADRYLRIRPGNSNMLYRKAMLLTRDASRLGEALELVNRAIEISDDPRYRSLRGLIQLEQKNYGGALLDLEAAARSQVETTAQFDLALAEAYAGTGDANRAQRFLDSAVEKAGGPDGLDSVRVERVKALLNGEGESA